MTKRSEGLQPNRKPPNQSNQLKQSNPFELLRDSWLKSQELVIMNCQLNSKVIVLNGTIDHWPAQSLLDSGASGNFLTRKFVNAAKIPTTSIQTKSVRLADGKVLTASEAVVDRDVNVKGKSVKCSFIVLDQLNNGNDAILGIPWLEEADPTISFKNRTISWKSESNPLENHQHIESSSQHSINQLSLGEFVQSKQDSTKTRQTQHNFLGSKITQSLNTRNKKRANTLPLDLNSLVKSELWNPDVEIESGDIVLMVNLKQVQQSVGEFAASTELNKVAVEELIERLSPVAKSIVTEYQDVFPEELPLELPPKRDADLKINLIPGSIPPTRAPYRMSTVELEELKKQLDKLLENGFVKPSLSPYSAPVLFVRKKTG